MSFHGYSGTSSEWKTQREYFIFIPLKDSVHNGQGNGTWCCVISCRQKDQWNAFSPCFSLDTKTWSGPRRRRSTSGPRTLLRTANPGGNSLGSCGQRNCCFHKRHHHLHFCWNDFDVVLPFVNYNNLSGLCIVLVLFWNVSLRTIQ